MQRITLLTSDLTESFTKHTDQITSIPPGMAGSSTKINQVAKAVARDISHYADELEVGFPEFSRTWDDLIESSTGLITHARLDNPEDVEALKGLRGNFAEFETSIGAAHSSALSAQETYSQLSGISRDLTRAIRRESRIMGAHIEEFSKGQSFASRMVNLIDEQLQ